MNAKKIMGAVLVALLAAALFVGAGAAADDTKGKVIFVYQKDTGLDGTWANGANTITFVGGMITGENIVEGVYQQGDNTITVKYPTGIVSATATPTVSGAKPYNIIGGVYFGGDTLSATAIFANTTATSPIKGFYVTQPNGVAVATGYDFKDVNGISVLASTGEYKVQVLFDAANTFFVDYMPQSYLIGKDVFTFTFVKEGDVLLTAAADSVVEGDALAVTITGQPGQKYTLIYEGFGIASLGVVTGTDNPAKSELVFTMSNTGKAVIYLKALDKAGEFTLTVKGGDEDKTVDVEILEGEITAAADKDAYFIGQKITLSGTNTGKSDLFFYIEGQNFPLKKIPVGSASVESDSTWEQEITYDDLKKVDNKKLDAGTYTIYVSTKNIPGVTEAKSLKPYTTVSVYLKQPFLTAELKTNIVAIGSDLIVTGTAESADEVMYYIFGNNFFDYNTTSVKQKDSSYKIELEIGTDVKMDAGQYFVVIQHPMYNTVFNIAPVADKGIVLNITGNAEIDGETIILESERQTANAAEALCQALDTQNIDDLYVKATFIVAAPTATMNPVPSEVAKGTKLTVSGTTNLAPGEIITVEMLSTAFAAVPKEDVNAAAFIALTTKVQDDGTWEVTFDTSALNIDEYNIQATVGEFITTAKVNVVEAADKPDTPDTPDVPDTPDTPDTPTEPETPGFGALAALAGLGAVAVLLLRRE